MNSHISTILGARITKEQSRDTGMALVLVLLIVRVFITNEALLPIAIIALVANMTFPQIYRPLAVLWLGFAHLLGGIMSRFMLTVVFFAVVTPVAFVRKLAGKDPMKLAIFKTGTDSVMVVRNHTFTAKDIEKPY
jgi:hypothetical protein